jgi:hypothetical protein
MKSLIVFILICASLYSQHLDSDCHPGAPSPLALIIEPRSTLMPGESSPSTGKINIIIRNVSGTPQTTLQDYAYVVFSACLLDGKGQPVPLTTRGRSYYSRKYRPLNPVR